MDRSHTARAAGLRGASLVVLGLAGAVGVELKLAPGFGCGQVMGIEPTSSASQADDVFSAQTSNKLAHYKADIGLAQSTGQLGPRLAGNSSAHPGNVRVRP